MQHEPGKDGGSERRWGRYIVMQKLESSQFRDNNPQIQNLSQLFNVRAQSRRGRSIINWTPNGEGVGMV
jgi:hypothetical protein